VKLRAFPQESFDLGGYWVNWPTSQWGARAKVHTSAETYAQIGVYQVNPNYVDDGWARRNGWKLNNPGGTTGALIPLEFGWMPTIEGRPGTYRAGVWYNTSNGKDLYEDVNGNARGITGDHPEVLWSDPLAIAPARAEWVSWARVRPHLSQAYGKVFATLTPRGASMSTSIVLKRALPTGTTARIPKDADTYAYDPESMAFGAAKPATVASKGLADVVVAVDQQPRGGGRPRGQFVRLVDGPLAGRYVRVSQATLTEPIPQDPTELEANPTRKAELEREFETMEVQRCYKIDERGEPYSFDFIVESVGVLAPSYIVARALEILQAKMLRYASIDSGDLPEQLKVVPADARMKGFDFVFQKEDHTLGNLLQTWMEQNLVDTEEITFVGYKVPHPLRDEMLLRVGVDSGKDVDARAAVAKAARECAQMFKNWSGQWASGGSA
jgi:DNA-directed RNA polymerase subunit L